MTYKVGAVSYPVSGASSNLLSVVDPFLNIALPFFEAALNFYLATAIAAAYPGQMSVAVRETTPLNPRVWLAPSTFRFPLLAIYCVSGQEVHRTIRWESSERIYRLEYYLPPTTYEQGKRTVPLLQAMPALLSQLVEASSDAAYNSSQDVWAAAKVERINVTRWNIDVTDDPAGQNNQYPTLVLDLNVHLREQDAGGGEALTYVLSKLQIQDDAETPLDLVEVRSDVVVP